jgi:hypothetical protein
MWDEIALVMAGSLILGGCGMQLEGGSVAENILDGGTQQSAPHSHLRVKFILHTWIIRKMCTYILCSVKNIRTDGTFN